jgi:hypothetical protein
VNYGAIQDYQNCLYYLKLYVSKYIKSKYNSELLARAKDLIPQVEAKIERDKKINALNETANRHAIHNEDIKKNDISKMTAQKNIHSKTYTKKIPIQDTKPEQRYIQSTDENRPSATSSNSSSLAYTNPAQKLPENSSGYSALSPVVQNKNNPVSGGDIMRKDHEASNVADSINFDAAVLENRSEEHVLRSMLDERMLITQLQSFL